MVASATIVADDHDNVKICNRLNSFLGDPTLHLNLHSIVSSPLNIYRTIHYIEEIRVLGTG